MSKEFLLISCFIAVAIGVEVNEDNSNRVDIAPFSIIGKGTFAYRADDFTALDASITRANRLAVENSEVVEASSKATCSNTGAPFTDAEREIFLSKHNNYRSQLAMGRSPLPDGSYASPASNMFKMSYNCELERIAQGWAQNCKFEHSPYEYRNGGENLYALYTSPGGNWRDQIISQPSDLWWDELKQIGGITRDNVTLTMDIFNKGIGHWSQMAWATTTSVGCGWAECPQGNMVMHFVVCNYRPSGNYINQNIYEIGNPCSKCNQAQSSRCEVNTGLCTA